MKRCKCLLQLNRMSDSKLLLSLFFIFFAYSSSYSSNDTRTCSLQQTHALLLFKQNVFSNNNTYDESVAGESICHPIMMNWKTSIDCCNWEGVTCNRFTGDVIALDLSCGMLQGTIHPNSTLFNLPHLQRLNLAFNSLWSSQLPREIGRFSNSLTHLNISQCGFTGQVPNDITLLDKLVSLDLSWNDLKLEPHVLNHLLQNSTILRDLSLSSVNVYSPLPINFNISSSLKSLSLGSTGLQMKLPDNIFNLPHLEELDLSFNDNLTGRLPKVNTSTNIPLKLLDLTFTGLSGEIPDSIGHLKSLNFLGLRDTNLSGEIPQSIGHLKSLNHLDLSSTNLSGEIPQSIGHLKSLNHLDLSFTNLSGEIPQSIGHLKSLNVLRLEYCGLMGPLPKSLFNLRNLTTLWLSSNKFNGTLPSSLFTLPSLESIDLSYNMFSGSLPSELFNHQSLKTLYLGGNQFVGEIDMQAFWKLVNLTSLDLSFNNFTGEWELDTLLSILTNITRLDLSYSGLSVVTNNENHYVNPNFSQLDLASCKLKVFPKSLRAMKTLGYLDLSNNKIHGNIPDWAGEIGGNQLYYLNLSNNFITSLPKLQWDGLWYLYLHSNLIQGSFPPSICNMSRLSYLDMSTNRFGGVIPQCLGNISSSLQMVDLGNNSFHGTIPNTWDDCRLLEGLILNGNSLEGDVPNGLSKCDSLKVVDLGNNQLNGTFPHQLGHLQHLQVLVLKSNKLHGPIESSSMIELLFQSLRVLDLSHNNFVGHLPQKYFQNFKSMKDVIRKGTKPQYLGIGGIFYSITLDVKGLQLWFPKILVDYTIINLSNNKFEGKIPNIIGSLNSLKALDLSHNNLDGRIPDALGNLSEIESLDLSWNRLTGEIPRSLANITTLAVLNLSQNHLIGRIPSGTQFSTFSTSFGGNSGLCGFPLPVDCRRLSTPQLGVVDGDEDESGFTWKVVMLGYGCGTLLGLVLGYLMLSTGRPKWFNAIADELEHMVQRRQKKRRYIVYIGK